MNEHQQITSPVAKAASAIGASGGASAMSVANQAGSFLPTDLAGWMALAASTAAVVYTLMLQAEFWWKKFIRPWCVSKGWLPKPQGTAFVVDSDGNVTREEP